MNNVQDKQITATDNVLLTKIQKEAFQYFLSEVNPVNGLIADKTQPGSPSSIAVTGMALTCYIIAAEKKWISRKAAIDITLRTLRFFYNSNQGKEKNATGYKGFYYHFLDMQTGQRAWNCELSTIDTALFIAGALSSRSYFTKKNNEEKEIRELADQLYRRIDWQWALHKSDSLCHGWKPGSGFLKYNWCDQYSEALLMYILAVGSPTFAIKAKIYEDWIDNFELTKVYDTQYLYAGPLFIHQFPHLWIDYRNIHDAFNKKSGFDYFENSSRATRVHHAHAVENKEGFEGIGNYYWGLTASDGPGKKTLKINTVKRTFFDYSARGAPFGPHDGTVSLPAVLASLPFAPDIVIPTIRHHMQKTQPQNECIRTLYASSNLTFRNRAAKSVGWVSPWEFGLNQAPIVIMIENYQSELIWTVMKKCNYLVRGLQLAGFSGEWLG